MEINRWRGKTVWNRGGVGSRKMVKELFVKNSGRLMGMTKGSSICYMRALGGEGR